MKIVNVLILTALMVAVAATQTPTRLEFDVVSVKPAEGLTAGKAASGGMKVDGAQIHMNRYSVRSLIQMAYDLRLFQVIGPDWLSALRFDIDAKLPAGATRAQVPEMIKSMLADRFGLTFHNDSKELSVYALVVVSGGPKLKDVSEPNEASDGTSPAESSGYGSTKGMGSSYSDGASYALGDGKFDAKKLTMVRLVRILTPCLDLPVIDKTGLTGKYDISFPLPDDEIRGMITRAFLAGGGDSSPEMLKFLDSLDNASLFDGLRANGLKLEPRKLPVPVMVIDSVLKTPTDN